ncbi:hypothetical protein TOPH_08347 [Tolypocladium ophioglossoides CBS 100239]|uniref:Uncharacterized protein n=1 Tax=Tolypocladium ophioglossoides (strain CBS 100239) TaxID=1163406 RepID=A0A0L0MZP8_TOLOC|nr:hypothetical protein TOPH_08347 [Tolypocladium ophioglossoides CBS 100239]
MGLCRIRAAYRGCVLAWRVCGPGGRALDGGPQVRGEQDLHRHRHTCRHSWLPTMQDVTCLSRNSHDAPSIGTCWVRMARMSHAAARCVLRIAQATLHLPSGGPTTSYMDDFVSRLLSLAQTRRFDGYDEAVQCKLHDSRYIRLAPDPTRR